LRDHRVLRRLLKSGAEPFLIEWSDNRHGFHLAVNGGDQPHDPEHHQRNVKHDNGQPAKDGNKNENELTDYDGNPRQEKTEHLPEMIRAKLRLFITVNDDGRDEAIDPKLSHGHRNVTPKYISENQISCSGETQGAVLSGVRNSFTALLSCLESKMESMQTKRQQSIG
jgi:hypothetical protein